ncbi:MAG: dockerin type I repeat-containing protein [Phycisphaerales bacterium]
MFRATFGEFPNFTDDPGFDTTGTTGFPNGTTFAFDLLDALRKWDGSDFDAVAVETIRVAKGSASVFTPPGVNEIRAGFAFGQVSLGFLHEHLRYTLQTPQSAGVYAMQMRVRVTTGGFTESLPFWIVFNQNASAAEHGAATQYLERLVTPPCPGDINDDGAVNTSDLTRFLGAFGQPTMRLANGDFNGDAAVNTSDLTFFLARFGGACP